MRALPSYYRGNSVYAMFPLVHPDRTKEILTKLGKVDEYDFSLPKVKHHPLSIKSYRAVKDILGNQNLFKVPCEYHKDFPATKLSKLTIGTRGTTHGIPYWP